MQGGRKLPDMASNRPGSRGSGSPGGGANRRVSIAGADRPATGASDTSSGSQSSSIGSRRGSRSLLSSGESLESGKKTSLAPEMGVDGIIATKPKPGSSQGQVATGWWDVPRSDSPKSGERRMTPKVPGSTDLPPPIFNPSEAKHKVEELAKSPEKSPDKKEVQRQRLSLFFQTEAKHSLKLAQGAHITNAIITVRSMCAFSSRGDGGCPVAVIIDQYRQFSNRTILRMAEVCIEYMIAVVQPNESREEAEEEGGVHSQIRLLTPGGPTIKTMAAPVVLACVQLVQELAQTMPQFAPLRDGSSFKIKAESTVAPAWKDDFQVRIEDDGMIWQQLPTPKMLKLVGPQAVCEALNLNMLALQTDFPVQIVQSVGRYIIVPLRSRRVIATLDPLFDLVSNICRTVGADGFHIFSMDPVSGGHLHTRNFSPLVLIEEEAASASANAALVAYLHYHRIMPIEDGDIITCEQGYSFSMKPRPSKVHVQFVFDPTDPGPMFASDTGLTSQNSWVGSATGDAVTAQRLMAKGDRYTSNVTDQSRFALPDGYYEAREQEERQRKFKMERAKRQGLIYKEEVKPHKSTAIMPPHIPLPAPIATCWVGGTAVPALQREYSLNV